MPMNHGSADGNGYSYDATVIFPNRGWQAVAYSVFVICLVTNSGILARRLESYKATFTSFKPLNSFWLCDVLTNATFMVSFLFIVINGILTFGIGTNLSPTCDASVVVCVSVFVLSKVFLYLFYLERLYLVNYALSSSRSPSSGKDDTIAPPHFMARFRVIPWLVGIGIFVFGVPSAILLGFSRGFQLIERNTAEGVKAVGCHVFLKWYFATPIIVWAAILNTYILISYILSFRNRYAASNTALKKVCKGSVWSALVSGLATVINLSVLLILKGEHGIECLLCCSIDVLVNSLVLALITSPKGESHVFSKVMSSSSSGRSSLDDSTDDQEDSTPKERAQLPETKISLGNEEGSGPVKRKESVHLAALNDPEKAV